MQALWHDLRKIFVFKNRVKQPLVFSKRRREFIDHRNDLVAPRSFDHDHRVVLVAELVDVLNPQPVIGAFGIQQIEPAAAVAEMRYRIDHCDGCQTYCDNQSRHRKSQRNRGDRRERRLQPRASDGILRRRNQLRIRWLGARIEPSRRRREVSPLLRHSIPSVVD